MHHILKRSAGLLSLSLLPLLTSCAPAPAIETKTVTVNVPVYVPLTASLTKPVPMPSLAYPVTNGALLDYILALQGAIRTANHQIQAIQALQPPLAHQP